MNTKKKGRRQRGRPGRKRVSGEASLRDWLGKEFGGRIAMLNASRPQNFTRSPQGPLPEAQYSTCQVVNTFATSTGISAGTTTSPPYIGATATTNNYWALAFEFSDLPQATTLSNLFDQYRLDKVELKLAPINSVIDLHTSTSPNSVNPSNYVALDFDDSTAVTSLNAIQQYDSCQVCQGNAGLFIEIQPAVTPALYQSSAFSGYAVQKAGWIDCNSTGVEHYGVKGVVTALNTSSTEVVGWNIECKYYMSFRNTR